MKTTDSATSNTLPPCRLAVHYGGEHRLRSENLAFDIDVWYPPLRARTMRTVFLPLARNDAAAIVAYYDAAFRRIPHGFTASIVDTLRALEARIDDLLQNDPSFARHGAFLRLCGRSPKDGEPTDPAVRDKIWQSYLEALHDETHQETDKDNARVAAIAKTPSYLRVTTGAEAMSLLLTSERVFSDMIDWLHYGEPEQLVFREFVDTFNVATEFRCYIQAGLLVGMSQYDTYAMHAYLQKPKERAIVICAVLEAWRKAKGCIDTIDGSYCIDFGVDLKQQTAHLIELSCFRKCTGPALFAWRGESNLVIPERNDVLDDTISNHGEGGNDVAPNAVFRVRSKVLPNIGELVEMNWDYRWSSSRHDKPKPFQEMYTWAIPQERNLVEQLLQWVLPVREQSALEHILFVYGTLKRGCHWHSKYMTGARFLGSGTTATPQCLVVGECGVPYLIRTKHPDNQALQVKGELWRLSEEMLKNMDEYEGVDKNHYVRELIEIVGSDGMRTVAFCYFYAVKSGASDVDISLLQAPRIAEYTVEEQRQRYKPIHHIQVKQLEYLGEETTT